MNSLKVRRRFAPTGLIVGLGMAVLPSLQAAVRI